MRYLDPLDIRKVGAREWELLSAFRFESDQYPGVFVVPAGTRTNFASIPRFFWRVLPPIGNYDEAATVHDAGCNGKLVTPEGQRIRTVKPVIDNLFHEALLCETFRKSQVGPTIARLMYEAVKLFGGPYET